MKLLHCEDFRDDAQYQPHLDNIIRILNEPLPPLGALIGLPSLPAHYLTRADRLLPLRDALRSGLESAVPFAGSVVQHFHGIMGVERHMGMHGMSGIGKSVLANLLARDRFVRQSFPDGIVWAGLGAAPNIAELMRRVHRDMGGDGLIETSEDGKAKLREAFKDKAVLLIFDDATRAQDLAAFDVLGPRCRGLITTRDAGLLKSFKGRHYLVELLTDKEAVLLLAVSVGKTVAELPTIAFEVLKKCGRLPLAIALAGGMVAAGSFWQNVLDALLDRELEYLADDYREEHHQNLLKTIEVSVQALPETDQRRLVELAVFPVDESVPETAVTTLWKFTGSLQDRHARRLVMKFKERSLIQVTVPPGKEGASLGWISLHDLIRDYCVRRAKTSSGDLSDLHQSVLDAYRAQCPGGWHTGPDDGYFFHNILRHLVEATGDWGESAALLCDFDFPLAKIRMGLAMELYVDYGTTLRALARMRTGISNGERASRKWVADLVRCARGLLRRDQLQPEITSTNEHGPDAEERQAGQWTLEEQLLDWQIFFAESATLLSESALAEAAKKHTVGLGLNWRTIGPVAESARRVASGGPTLRRRWPPQYSPRGTMIGLVKTSSGPVRGLAMTPDRTLLVSGDEDGLRIWNLSGRGPGEPVILSAKVGGVTCVAITPDGKTAVSGHEDGAVCVWWALDTLSSTPQVLQDQPSSVRAIAVTADGTLVVTGRADGTVCEWDLTARHPAVHQLWDEPKGRIISLAMTPDGAVIAAGGFDGVSFQVCLWKRSTPQESSFQTSSLGLESTIGAIDIKADGTRAISGHEDGSVWLWDLTADAPRCTRKYAVDWRAWNASSMADIPTPFDRNQAVSMTPDGVKALSGHSDGSLRVWDLTKGVYRSLKTPSSVLDVLISIDGIWGISGHADGCLRMWNLEVEDTRSNKATGGIASLALAPNGRWAISGHRNGGIQVFDYRDSDPRITSIFEGDDYCTRFVGFTPDGSQGLCGMNDGTAGRFEIEPHLGGNRYSTGSIWDGIGAVNSLAVTGCGNFAVIGYGQFRFWHLGYGETVKDLRPEHRGHLRTVIATPDWSRMLSVHYPPWEPGTHDEEKSGLVYLWSLTDLNGECGRVIGNKGGDVTGMVITPDGTHAVMAHESGSFSLWDVRGGESTGQVSRIACPSRSTCLAIAHDGSHLFSGQADGTILVLALAGSHLEEAFVLPALSGVPLAVAAFPDGNRLLSVKVQGDLYLWDLDERKLVTVASCHAQVEAFATNWHRLVVGLADAIVDVLDLQGFDDEMPWWVTPRRLTRFFRLNNTEIEVRRDDWWTIVCPRDVAATWSCTIR